MLRIKLKHKIGTVLYAHLRLVRRQFEKAAK